MFTCMLNCAGISCVLDITLYAKISLKACVANSDTGDPNCWRRCIVGRALIQLFIETHVVSLDTSDPNC